MKIEITEQEKEDLLKAKVLISCNRTSYKLAQSLVKQIIGKKLDKIVFRMPVKRPYFNNWYNKYNSCYWILNNYNPHMLRRLINALVRERDTFYKG